MEACPELASPLLVGSGGEKQVKPRKKRRIESRDDRSRSREVAGRNDDASAPRTKRLPVPGMLGQHRCQTGRRWLPDYNDVIGHPMDFDIVKRKLARNVYCSLQQFEVYQRKIMTVGGLHQVARNYTFVDTRPPFMLFPADTPSMQIV